MLSFLHTTKWQESYHGASCSLKIRTRTYRICSAVKPMLLYIIKIKIHSSCEIEYFVETHLCKLCVILRSRVVYIMHNLLFRNVVCIQPGGRKRWRFRSQNMRLCCSWQPPQLYIQLYNTQYILLRCCISHITPCSFADYFRRPGGKKRWSFAVKHHGASAACESTGLLASGGGKNDGAPKPP